MRVGEGWGRGPNAKEDYLKIPRKKFLESFWGKCGIIVNFPRVTREDTRPRRATLSTSGPGGLEEAGCSTSSLNREIVEDKSLARDDEGELEKIEVFSTQSSRQTATAEAPRNFFLHLLSQHTYICAHKRIFALDALNYLPR